MHGHTPDSDCNRRLYKKSAERKTAGRWSHQRHVTPAGGSISRTPTVIFSRHAITWCRAKRVGPRDRRHAYINLTKTLTVKTPTFMADFHSSTREHTPRPFVLSAGRLYPVPFWSVDDTPTLADALPGSGLDVETIRDTGQINAPEIESRESNAADLSDLYRPDR